ncbi:MAG: Bpu10I family restriction endonuclease [Deltaproteobacteria bacterium]|nr:Bpu10I family restriction endonuclease [Deltaproteobacteria bacterium]
MTAAVANPKCASGDRSLLKEALAAYEQWASKLGSLTSSGKDRIKDMTHLLNEYKDFLEVELIAKRGSAFIKRQKGQLKLDNSVMEEFLIHLVTDKVFSGLPTFSLEIGPQTAFMSLAFTPANLAALGGKPPVTLKEKDTDFALGKTVHFQFSTESTFPAQQTTRGKLMLAVLAAECKVNLDKTMFQEAAGTAARFKQGCPVSRYYLLVEYLDMEPEDSRLTALDNVFLLRHAKRLPFEKRSVYTEVKRQHEASPIDAEIMWRFVQEVQGFIDAVWYDPRQALRRGSFI